ncbi:Crp/Fnr family transcriptional regulator [Sphingomonas sp. PB2P12]|uniref:Crp/Fnr family transcriptional regulator n=1 Tax=Sphingomonas sandaracina TaxID=3096157 RepID=UPI002FC9FEC5
MHLSSTGYLAPALRKLEQRAVLSRKDRDAFHGLPFNVRSLSPHSYVIRERDLTKNCCVLISGFAFRSKIVGNGGRQILSIHIPGDMLDIQNAFLGVADHSIQMLTAGDVAYVAAGAVQDIAIAFPAIGRALWLETLVEGSIFREWIANIGRRDARTRVAHLLCEIAVRLRSAGLMTGNRYELPMTQEQIGDATGLTPVHVNRTLQLLRTDGLVTRDKRAVQIENWEALSAVGDFDAAYLHADNPKTSTRALGGTFELASTIEGEVV